MRVQARVAGREHFVFVFTILSQEVIMRFDTGLSTNNTFYTDANGLEFQERILNYRPTWNVSMRA